MPIRVATVRATDVPATQTNIPVYVDLGRVGATALTLAEAQSSRWYTDTDLVTQMAREIVSLTEGHGKYASLTSTSKIAIDYDGIRADYGVGATYGRNAVWSDYRAVYHLGDTTDSTGNGYTLTNTNSVPFTGTGKLGSDTADYGASNPNTSAGKKLLATSNLGVAGNVSAVFSAWLRRHNEITLVNNNEEMMLAHRSNSGADRFWQAAYQFNGGAYRYLMYPGRTPFGLYLFTAGTTWFKYKVVRNSTTNYQSYLGGALINTASFGTASTGQNLFGLGTEGGNFGLWRGLFDEARVKLGTDSANWETTEYNNQNAEATFWGTWTTFGGGGGPSEVARRGAVMMM